MSMPPRHPIDMSGEDTRTQLALLGEQIRNMKHELIGAEQETQQELGKLEALLERYLLKAEFWAHFSPVRMLVYGIAGIMLMAVITAIVTAVVHR